MRLIDTAHGETLDKTAKLYMEAYSHRRYFESDKAYRRRVQQYIEHCKAIDAIIAAEANG